MKNNESIIWISVGALLLGALGYYVYQNRGLRDRISDAAEDFMGDTKEKYNDVKQKAKREYQKAKDSGEELVDSSKERANQWINRTQPNM